MLETDLYQLLSTDAGVAAAMGNVNNVFLGAIPKGRSDLKTVVIQVTHTDRITGADGPNRLTMKRVQFDSYDESYAGCVTLSNAILNLVKTVSGSLATTQIQGTIAETDIDMGQEASDNAAGGYIFRRMLEFDIWHTDLQAGDLANTYTPSSIPAPGGNASLLEGIPISVTPPTNGQGLIFNSSTGQWAPGAAGGGSNINFSDDETPAGTVDGVNAIFTWAHTPLGSSLLFTKNGQIMIAGVAYTLAGNVATFNAGYIPQPSDVLAGWYRF